MRLGSVLGGAARGFKDTYSKMDEWEKQRRERETQDRLAEAAASMDPEDTVVGSRDQPTHASEWARQVGVPEEIAAGGVTQVQEWLAAQQAAAPPAAAIPTPGGPAAFDEAILPTGPGDRGPPPGPATPGPPAPRAAPDLTGWHSYKDRVGGQTFYTRTPTRISPVDRVERLAAALEESGDPLHIARASALRSEALAQQLQRDQVERSAAERGISAARRALATGGPDAAMEIIDGTYNSMDTGTYVRTSRDETGQMVRQYFHSGTGTPVSKPMAVNVPELLDELQETVSSEDYYKMAEERRRRVRAGEDSAAAAVKMRIEEANAQVAEGTVDADIEAGRLKPAAMRAGIDQTRASTAETRSQTGAREALLPGQLEQQDAQTDATRAQAAAARASAAPRSTAGLTDKQQDGLNRALERAEEAAAEQGLKPGTPAYQSFMRRHRDQALGYLGIRPPGAERYQPPTPDASERVSSGLGPRRSQPTTNGRASSSDHRGVDYRYPPGTPFAAAGDGVVTHSGPRGGLGNVVEIKLSDGSRIVYAHASQLGVRKGDRVIAGQVVGQTGATGNVTGPNLHVEYYRADGTRGDPRTLFGATGPSRPKPTTPARAAAIPARPAAAPARAPVKRYPWGAPAK